MCVVGVQSQEVTENVRFVLYEQRQQKNSNSDLYLTYSQVKVSSGVYVEVRHTPRFLCTAVSVSGFPSKKLCGRRFI